MKLTNKMLGNGPKMYNDKNDEQKNDVNECCPFFGAWHGRMISMTPIPPLHNDDYFLVELDLARFQLIIVLPLIPPNRHTAPTHASHLHLR